MDSSSDGIFYPSFPPTPLDRRYLAKSITQLPSDSLERLVHFLLAQCPGDIAKADDEWVIEVVGFFCFLLLLSPLVVSVLLLLLLLLLSMTTCVLIYALCMLCLYACTYVQICLNLWTYANKHAGGLC